MRLHNERSDQGAYHGGAGDVLDLSCGFRWARKGVHSPSLVISSHTSEVTHFPEAQSSDKFGQCSWICMYFNDRKCLTSVQESSPLWTSK